MPSTFPLIPVAIGTEIDPSAGSMLTNKVITTPKAMANKTTG